MMTKNSKWCIYSGDVTKDGFIDGSDVSLVDVDLYNYAFGWIVTDLTGDQFVDGADMSILDINSYNYVGVIKPIGAPGYMKMLNRPKRENKKINTDVKYTEKFK